jgi:hypothetical protein
VAGSECRIDVYITPGVHDQSFVRLIATNDVRRLGKAFVVDLTEKHDT